MIHPAVSLSLASKTNVSVAGVMLGSACLACAAKIFTTVGAYVTTTFVQRGHWNQQRLKVSCNNLKKALQGVD